MGSHDGLKKPIAARKAKWKDSELSPNCNSLHCRCALLPLLFTVLIFAGPALAASTPADIAKQVDRVIDLRLEKEKIPPSLKAVDAEILRRLYLDLIGRVPTLAEATAFLESREADKRSKLIERLLKRHEYGRHFAIQWHKRIGMRSDFVDKRIEKSMYPWLVDQFNRNRPWSEMVRDMLLAEGDVHKNGATNFYLSELNTIEGIVQADRVAGLSAQLFLGVNLRCAQCHDHPFADWKQTEFWEFAVFFGRIGYADKSTTFKQLVEAKIVLNKDGQRMPSARDDASIKIPGSDKVVQARFLDGSDAKLDPTRPFRPVLTQWLTGKNNERFAAAAVNRMWNHLMGRGLVMPVDDMHDQNPAELSEVMSILSRRFAETGHDIHDLIRCICLTDAYQRTSRPLPENRRDRVFHSHQALKQLTPEMLYDSLAMITDGQIIGSDALESVRSPARDHWLNFFNSLDTGEDATRYTHGVPQALKMLNSQLSHANSPLIRKLSADKTPWNVGVSQIYIAVLSRHPTPDELELFRRHHDEVKNLDTFYRQSLWSLINSSEFVFNH
jgi:hypothetical protein